MHWLAQLLQDLGLQEILVAVGRRRPLPLPPAVAVVEDLYPGLGPLAGIHAGLRAAHNPACLVVACDMPFLALALARELLRWEKPVIKVCLRQGLIEPFPGIYPKTILSALELSLAQGRLSAQEFIRAVPHVFVPEEVVSRLDPEGRSFMNLNTWEVWRCVQFG